MSLSGADSEKIIELCSKTHRDQAVWFLNANWSKLGTEEAERLYKFVQKFNELDSQHHEEGTSLDEMTAHRFLEAFNETMTVVAMRTKLRDVGAIPKEGRPKSFPITHFLIARYEVDWNVLVNASQGDNAEELAKAQAMLKEAQAAIPEAQARAKEAAAAAAEQARLQAEYDGKTATLQKKSEEGGVVSRNRSKNELAQHLAEDPLPLRRAKITCEAASKRAEKALKIAQDRVAELEAYLKTLQATCGSAQGALWWIERDLYESKKYMPLSKGGVQR
eukprot:TRINITY_DN14834_c0_g1_i1.p1 TRINITY_DN14834_c0_g1~~TRINITY_DN14834_c0_g1_i1.p1  ORF type:complete len:293 (+),score=90.85 TRINITY_DN14834_c0_g1_i1:49-879(+)